MPLSPDFFSVPTLPAQRFFVYSNRAPPARKGTPTRNSPNLYQSLWEKNRPPRAVAAQTKGDRSMAGEQSETQRPLRILLAKAGLDGHDRGVHVIAAALRDAGMEVIYTGLRQTPEAIVRAAIQEDVDAIGISVLSGAHMTQFTKVLQTMRDEELGDVLLFGGGIIPERDKQALEAEGVGRLFGPGTPLEEIVRYLEAELGHG